MHRAKHLNAADKSPSRPLRHEPQAVDLTTPLDHERTRVHGWFFNGLLVQ
jgi:hypothetical protein